jgi:hypothetical protein
MKNRRQRSDSTTAQVMAFQRKREFTAPEFINLRTIDFPFWEAAIQCRDDWQPHELILLAHLARALADAERLHLEIEAEGAVIDGKPNPKCAIEETLTRRALALTRHLQIHALATRGDTRDVAKRPPAPLLDFDDDLIAR